MDDMIKNSIDSRKNSIFTIYEVNDKKLLKEIDNIFEKMEDLGKSCKDVMDFETKLASSSLNQEYIELFSKIAQSSNSHLNNGEYEETEVKTTGEEIAGELASEARYQMKEATLPARRIAREAAEKKLRSTPIIGDIMHAKQLGDFFGGFRRKKKAKEEQERLQKELDEELNK